MTELSRANAKLAHIRRMVHGPGPSGGFTATDEANQADYVDDLIQAARERGEVTDEPDEEENA